MDNRTCAEPDCARPSRARGYCQRHWRQKINSGELLRLPRLTTEQRFWSKVDKSGDCWEWTGAVKETGYGAFRGDDGSTLRPHRFSFHLHHGYLPSGDVDHACGNRLCVNPAHLRDASRKQNMENLTVLRSNNTSGFRGVYFGEGKWRAQIGHNKKTTYIGGFDTAEEAAEAARQARLELFTHNDRDRIA